MSTSKKITHEQFKKVYCDTLQQTTKGNFIKLPVANYTELGLMQYYLIKSLDYMATANLYTPLPNGDFSYTIQTICKILEETIPQSEFEGLDKI